MAGARSLLEFVEAARDRALARDRIARWHRDAKEYSKRRSRRIQALAADLAEGACRCCLEGRFARAVAWTSPDNAEVDPFLWDRLRWLEECPPWVEFADAVDVAERIDSLLATQEWEGVARELARDCRTDLDLLLVLSDHCADAGLAHAAEEARHLHRLTRLPS